MQQPDARDREIRTLRERLSRLSEAGRRINESLELDIVLQEVLDSARALTGARYGVIILLNGAGEVEDFLASGLTPGEAQGIWSAPDGLRFFEYLGGVAEPLRVADLLGHLRAQGLPDLLVPIPVSAFLAAPIRHRGERTGNVYLAKQEPGGEFSREDEELLALFASQAALVIANARRHREERRARAGLETLVDTSPVGVVVFDARNGRVASLNREARRIAGGLLSPEEPVERALERLTFRRGDGREVSLAEFTLAQALSAGETVRAEEIALELPDGQSVTALVNATPILGAEGAVDSCVVTLQDLTPLEELERLRLDFLGAVSHELRMPLTSIRGSATTLLDQEAALDPAEIRLFHRIILEQADRMRGLLSDLLDLTRIETGTLLVSPGPAEVTALVDEARSAFLAGSGSRNIALDLGPDLPWVMADRRRIAQVLGNLLSNAARHSPEGSVIRVSAFTEDGCVGISVTDEGRGIEPERLPHVFRRHARIAGGREVLGAGLGLSICKGIVEAHGGRIRAESEGAGLGSRFTFTLPTAGEGGCRDNRRSARPGPETGDSGRILVVDDDPRTLRHVRDILAEAGYTPLVTGDPEEALRLFRAERPRLALLDLLLPGSDGIELMGHMLRIAERPVIFLSAHGGEDIIGRAFGAGAVDYVVKPFSATELLARVRNALRRGQASSPAEPTGPFALGDLGIDYEKRRVSVAGEPVQLTVTEYELLRELSVNAGQALTFDHLLRRVWGPENARDKRSVRAYVKRLRRKLGEDALNPRYIFAEPRVGYRMGEPDARAGAEA